MSYDSKDIVAVFYEEVSTSEKSTRFKCRCGVERAQNMKKGYQNGENLTDYSLTLVEKALKLKKRRIVQTEIPSRNILN